MDGKGKDKVKWCPFAQFLASFNLETLIQLIFPGLYNIYLKVNNEEL